MRQKEDQLKRNCAEQNKRQFFNGEKECLEQAIAQAEADLKKLQELDPEGAARMEQEEARNYAEILKKIQERELQPVAETEDIQD